MHILTADNLSKSYTEKVLFKDISFSIQEGDKIGLIGINGTGKSTLLKIIARAEQEDSGKILKAGHMHIAYLPQNPIFEKQETVLEHIFSGTSPVMTLLREYETALLEMEMYPEDQKRQETLLQLQQKMDQQNAWTIENEARTILQKLGIGNYHHSTSVLSGGQKKRVAMAAALLQPADLLIMDEPTNHLDSESIDWLENYLKNFKGALLMVTHDRYFLTRVCNRMLELDQGNIYSYQANYPRYLEIKAEREEMSQSAERKRQSLLQSELAWMRQGAKARTTKQKARIQRFQELQSQAGIRENQEITIQAGASRLGGKTVILEKLGYSWGNQELFKDFSYILLRDDRIGILGPNGAGKTTLLDLIAGLRTPSQGSIVRGETVKIGYFGQENQGMDEGLRVIEYIREEGEYLQTGEGLVSASRMLERFLFPPSLQWTPIAKLSGGEKRRLYLLRVLMGAPNVLLLDEPTNDLDIQTLTILEAYLDDFPGVVIVVSHDRYFIDRVTEKLWIFKPDKTLEVLQASYDEYSKLREEQEVSERNGKGISAKNTGNLELEKEKGNEKIKEKIRRLTYKEEKEYAEIEQVVADLEAALQEADRQIQEAASDFSRLQPLLDHRSHLEEKLNETMDRWVYLQEIAETMEKKKS